MDKLPTSTGDRQISEASPVSKNPYSGLYILHDPFIDSIYQLVKSGLRKSSTAAGDGYDQRCDLGCADRDSGRSLVTSSDPKSNPGGFEHQVLPHGKTICEKLLILDNDKL